MSVRQALGRTTRIAHADSTLYSVMGCVMIKGTLLVGALATAALAVAFRWPTSVGASETGRLGVQNRAIVDRDGTRFRWRGVTAFALPEQIAHGRETEAVRFLDWARDSGFNVVRVLAMAHTLFQLTPEEGRAALPRLLALAAQRGLQVEVVALADTQFYPLDRAGLHAQVEGIGRIALRHVNAIVQVANEHDHPTQLSLLHTSAAVRELAQSLPAGVLYTESPAANDTASEPGGQFLTRHLARGGNRWTMVARVRELADLSSRLGKPIVNDEPIGADERSIPGRRQHDPAVFAAMAMLDSLYGLAGGTFHCEDCLRALVPGPVQQQCAAAWIDGSRVIPDQARPVPYGIRDGGSPVSGAAIGRTFATLHVGVAGRIGWVMATGVTADLQLRWSPDWEPAGPLVTKWPGVAFVSIRRIGQSP